MTLSPRKLLKWLGITLGVILIGLGGFALYVNFAPIPTYDVAKIDLKIEATPARLDRGKILVNSMCVSCHLDPQTGKLTGKKLGDVPAEFGNFYSRNITNHPVKGIGRYSDGELAHLFRTGISRDGRYLPIMARFPHMADEDLFSIIAYLRSDDPMFAADTKENRDMEPTFLGKFLMRTVFSPLEYPTAPIPMPDRNNKLAYGEYLVNGVYDCYACHSADFQTNDELNPKNSEGYLAGSHKFADVNGREIYSANITFDKETGIGNWSLNDFALAIRGGFRPNGEPVRYPMEQFRLMPDREVESIYEYLKSVPPVKKAAPRNDYYSTVMASASVGKKIYYKYGCQYCHGESGVSQCNLLKADSKYQTNEELALRIRKPSEYNPGARMPDWEGRIKEEEYAPLADYVRELCRAAAKSNVSTASMAH